MRGRCTNCRKIKKLVMSPQDMSSSLLGSSNTGGLCRKCRKLRIVGKVADAISALNKQYLVPALSVRSGRIIDAEDITIEKYGADICKMAADMCRGGKGYWLVANSSGFNGTIRSVRNELSFRYADEYEKMVRASMATDKKQKKSTAKKNPFDYKFVDNFRNAFEEEPIPAIENNRIAERDFRHDGVVVLDIGRRAIISAPRQDVPRVERPILRNLPGHDRWVIDASDGGYFIATHNHATRVTIITRFSGAHGRICTWLENCRLGFTRGLISDIEWHV